MLCAGLFSTAPTATWNDRSRRGWTTLTSFGLQALAVAFLLALPLLRPTGLPLFRPVSAPLSLGQPLTEVLVNRTQAAANRTAPSTPTHVVWRQPSRIPVTIPTDTGDEGTPAPPAIGSLPGTGSGPDVRGDVFAGSGNGPAPIMPAAPKPAASPLRISRMSEGDLVYKVLPAYPPLARTARVQGAVVLQAIIGKDGAVKNLRMLSGSPMLVSPALDAVRQWRYRPYVLNGEPVEVETQIIVTFSLDGH